MGNKNSLYDFRHGVGVLAGKFGCRPERTDSVQCPFRTLAIQKNVFWYIRRTTDLSAPSKLSSPLSGGKCIFAFLDDTMIVSEDVPSHLRRLEEVFRRFRDAGLTLKLKKCYFLR